MKNTFIARLAQLIIIAALSATFIPPTARAQSIASWGANTFGQLGDATNSNRSTPVSVASITNATTIGTALRSSYAIKSDGTAWGWGYNTFGLLGDNSTTHRLVPVQVGTFSNVVGITGGWYHTVMLRSDGTVWSCGYNGLGQLGDGTTSDKNTPVQVSNLSSIKMVGAGQYFSLALKSDGTVWGWGDNASGQLGNGTNNSSNTPVQVSNLSSVTAIGTGLGIHAVALKRDGTVWAWGSGASGQLGNGANSNSNVPVQVSNLTSVTAVAVGYQFTLALKSDGTVWAWGNNNDGQLGNGTNNNSNIPVQVASLTNVIAISGGVFHGMAIKSDGTVWAWGYNGNNQLGDGTNNSSNVPVQVSGLTGMRRVAASLQHSLAMQGGADLKIESMTLTKAFGMAGDTATLTVTIANVGSTIANNFNLDVWFHRLAVPACGDTGSVTETIASLASGATLQFSYELTFPNDVGGYYARALVDSTCAVTENSESNNSMKVNYRTTLPNLQIQSVSVSPAEGAPGTLGTMTVVIQNLGQVDANSAFKLGLWYDRAGVAACGDPASVTINIPSLAAGASLTHEQTFTFGNTVGKRRALAYVDSDCDIDETNESYKQQVAANYNVLLPDLVIQSIELSPTSGEPGTTASLTVTIQNRGSVASGPFQLDTWYALATSPNCGDSGNQDEVINSLAAGATVSFTYEFEFPNGFRNYRVRVFVDSQCAVPESNENNNRGYKDYTVTRPPAPASIPPIPNSGTPTSP
jgi:alpha-tubulin suppressor-like RCC1 family protein